MKRRYRTHARAKIVTEVFHDRTTLSPRVSYFAASECANSEVAREELSTR